MTHAIEAASDEIELGVSRVYLVGHEFLLVSQPLIENGNRRSLKSGPLDILYGAL